MLGDKKTCPTCGGFGKVTGGDGCFYTCEECHGVGHVHEPADADHPNNPANEDHDEGRLRRQQEYEDGMRPRD
jgi:DnaJ-class molecular chaperone